MPICIASNGNASRIWQMPFGGDGGENISLLCKAEASGSICIAMCNVKEGDLVLLKDTQVKRNLWPMALVTKTHPRSDGKVRKLELKVTKNGTVKTFLRPVTEVVVLMSP